MKYILLVPLGALLFIVSVPFFVLYAITSAVAPEWFEDEDEEPFLGGGRVITK
jgi:hypothetical protein